MSKRVPIKGTWGAGLRAPCPYCIEVIHYEDRGDRLAEFPGEPCEHYAGYDGEDALFEPDCDDNNDPHVRMSREEAKRAGATFEGEE